MTKGKGLQPSQCVNIGRKALKLCDRQDFGNNSSTLERQQLVLCCVVVVIFSVGHKWPDQVGRDLGDIVRDKGFGML